MRLPRYADLFNYRSMSKMKSSLLRTIFQNHDDRNVASILFKLIFAAWTTYLVVIGAALYWRDRNLILIAGIGIVWLCLPLGLVLRGHTRSGGIIIIQSILWTATIIATNGQGIYDIAVLAFPVVVIIAGLIMQRRDFFSSSFSVLVAAGWLVFGQALGWFVPKPSGIPDAVDFVVVAVILLVTIVAADLLAENMRANLLQARQEIARRKKMEGQLRQQSIHDVLTGIYNRTFFEQEVARLECSREFPVSIIVADIDNLKGTNDVQGHAVGDELLRHTSTILGGAFRADDMLARIGGDEFAILLPRTDAGTVEQMLSRVHAEIDEYNTKSSDLPVQLSLGAATAEQSNIAHAFVVADHQMYANKALRKSKK